MLWFRVYGRTNQVCYGLGYIVRERISDEWDLEHPTHQRIVRFSMSGDEHLGTRGNPEQ